MHGHAGAPVGGIDTLVRVPLTPPTMRALLPRHAGLLPPPRAAPRPDPPDPPPTPPPPAKPRGRKPGTSHSPETRAKMAAAKRGRAVALSTRLKQSAAMRGRTASEATRAKMAAARRRYWAAKRGDEGEEEEEEDHDDHAQSDVATVVAALEAARLTPDAARTEMDALRRGVTGWTASFEARHGRPPTQTDAAAASPATLAAFVRYVALREYVRRRG